MLFALVVLLYLAISPLRALVTDVHLSAQRHAQLVTLRRQAAGSLGAALIAIGIVQALERS